MSSRTRVVQASLMSARAGLTAPALRLAAIACAALLAAALGHFLIDVAGDFLLAHDSYDDVGHSSRGFASGVAALLALFFTVRLLVAAHGEGLGPRGLRAAIAAALGARWSFVASVSVASLAATAVMEFGDTAAAGAPTFDVATLFGGSLPFGCAISIAVAALVASAFRALLLVVASSDAAILQRLAVWFRRLRGAVAVEAADRSKVTPSNSFYAGSPASRRAGKRAPPAFIAYLAA